MHRSRRGGFTALELLVVIAIVGLLTSLTLGAVQRARAAAGREQCANNLRQVGLALHTYHQDAGSFPPGAMGAEDPCPFLAWSGRLLPYVEQGSAWNEAVQDYAAQPNFASPVPHRNLGRPMSVYLCPTSDRATGFLTFEQLTVGFTYYIGVAGGAVPRDGTLFFNGTVRIGEITDGTSQTLLVGERPPSTDQYFGWWYAGVGQQLNGSADYMLLAVEWNYTFRAPMCPHGPYTFGPGNPVNMCDTFHFWSRHPGGANFLFADGSVHFLSYGAAPVLPDLASRAGGETIQGDY